MHERVESPAEGLQALCLGDVSREVCEDKSSLCLRAKSEEL